MKNIIEKLQLSKIHLLQNVSVRPATGGNLAPIGLVNCTFMLGDCYVIQAVVSVSCLGDKSLSHVK